jgi:formylglycine-generating enzyme required for sulfatase activity
MVVIPSGQFEMGSQAKDGTSEANERPLHRVTFKDSFAVGRYAVTFDEWDACGAEGGCGTTVLATMAGDEDVSP